MLVGRAESTLDKPSVWPCVGCIKPKYERKRIEDFYASLFIWPTVWLLIEWTNSRQKRDSLVQLSESILLNGSDQFHPSLSWGLLHDFLTSLYRWNSICNKNSQIYSQTFTTFSMILFCTVFVNAAGMTINGEIHVIA